MENKKRILLVDDEDAILFGFSKVLKEPGIELDCAQTLDEALKLIGNHQYDGAVIDLRLSNSTELEGFACIRQLRSRQKKSRIIVLTAFGDNHSWERAEDLAVDMFLEKPVEPEALRKTLKTLGVYCS
jgi:two-component system, response regulator, stage 0 sporulation protein F